MSNAATQSQPKPAAGVAKSNQVASQDEALETLPDLVTYATTYARQHPDVAALWVFGIGFVLGWKLKPW
jgi:hypothetical protein